MYSVTEFGLVVRQQMDEWGLHDWEFGYANWKRRLGECSYRERLLTFSLPYIQHNPIDVTMDTIKHEIAHAKIGPGHGHGREWKRIAQIVGARPRACAAVGSVIIPFKYFVQCPVHGVVGKWNRRPKYPRYGCRKCGRAAGFFPIQEFTGEINV